MQCTEKEVERKNVWIPGNDPLFYPASTKLSSLLPWIKDLAFKLKKSEIAYVNVNFN